MVAAYFEDSYEMQVLFETKDRARRATAKINGVFETIRNYEIPFVLLNGDEGVESICRVFETINSTGTRLTTFDLAVARYFSDGELNLRDMFDEAVAKYPILGEQRLDIDGERILQVILIKYMYENDRFIEPTRGKLLSLRPEYILDNWGLAVESLNKAYTWFSEECGVTPRNTPNQVVFTSSASMFAIFRDEIKNIQNFTSLLRRWFFANSMQKALLRQQTIKLDSSVKICLILLSLEN